MWGCTTTLAWEAANPLLSIGAPASLMHARMRLELHLASCTKSVPYCGILEQNRASALRVSTDTTHLGQVGTSSMRTNLACMAASDPSAEVAHSCQAWVQLALLGVCTDLQCSLGGLQ